MWYQCRSFVSMGTEKGEEVRAHTHTQLSDYTPLISRRLWKHTSSRLWAVYKNFASQSQHKYKIIIFFSGEANDSVFFPFYLLLHKRAKPAPSLVRRRRRRILLPCFANAKPCRRQAIITLGANATTCRRQAIYILVSIPPPTHPPIPRQRRQTNTPKAY